MRRRSQGRTSVTKEPSPAPIPSPSAASKRELPNDGEQADDTSSPSKRQRVNSPKLEMDENKNETGDQTLVQETGVNGDAASPPGDEEGAQASPKSTAEVPASTPAPTRHKRFWYEDGSVVLQIQHVLFRLHKSLLSIQSSYFRDLFADAQRPAEHYIIEPGITLPFYVISINGLQLSDVERLLEEYENPHANPGEGILPHDDLCAVARAAYELYFNDTHAWAKQDLLIYWPSNLDRIPSEPADNARNAMSALQVSVDADIPEIRKGALYELLRLPDFGQSDDEDDPQLEHADYNILTRARQHCARTWMDVLLVPPRRTELCAEEEKKSGNLICAARSLSQRRSKWLAIVADENLRKYTIDPVAGFRALQNISIPLEEKSGFCFECRQSWRRTWKKQLQHFWDGLDEVLGIELASEAEETEEAAT